MTRTSFSILVVITAALIGSGLTLVFRPFLSVNESESVDTSALKPGEGQGEIAFNPPPVEDAPEKIRDAVQLGYQILMDTQKQLPQHVGNQLNCKNCHFEAGREKETISLVGVASAYPKYRQRQHYAADLMARTND